MTKKIDELVYKKAVDLLEKGVSRRRIALIVGRNVSTINRYADTIIKNKNNKHGKTKSNNSC